MPARDKHKRIIFEGDEIALPCRVVRVIETLATTKILVEPMIHAQRAEGQPFLLEILSDKVELNQPKP